MLSQKITKNKNIQNKISFSSLGSNGLLKKGKSSLTVRFVDGHFVESYYPTIENTFSKTIKFRGQDYATEIVDTAGQVAFLFFFSFLFSFFIINPYTCINMFKTR